MALFARLLVDDPTTVVPTLDAEFTTDRVLAMSFLRGQPIEQLASAPQDTRNAAMTNLITLVLRELFEFGVMQTDPNFANYRFQEDTQKLVLLDFGAARPVSAATGQAYRRLLRAGLDEDRDAIRQSAAEAGMIGPHVLARHGARIDQMIDIILADLHRPGPFDFGDRSFVAGLRDHGMKVAADRAAWDLPPADLLFVQRKISGTALLAARLGARVGIRDLVETSLKLKPMNTLI
jgi:predicted unusual protein kinase regulating ubiquinone biosynthesis (AarF/ABC1/UbiB family)